jgi:hypothetical protein
MKIRKRYKLLIIIACALIVWCISYFVNIVLFWSLFALGCFVLLSIFTFILLNKLLQTTNWYKNNFIYTKQFVSNVGYRKDTQRNYEIVNVGSNPARFAFFYENVLGQNWSTGTQGLNMDLEILKYFHSYLKDGGVVLLPVVAFSSVSGYLTDTLPYMSKFASILNEHQINILPRGKDARIWMKYPLFYNWKLIRF